MAAGVKDNLALIRAIRAGHLKSVRRELAAGANLNAADKNGWNPVLHAAWAGRPAILQAVLAAGGDKNSADEDGRTALMAAATAGRGKPDTLSVLIAAGADVKARDKNDSSALIAAARMGRIDSVRALIAAGADLDRDACSAISAAEGIMMRARMSAASTNNYRDVISTIRRSYNGDCEMISNVTP
jgi:ankyrin repeat protein